jgi:hypothetical protein
MQYKLCVYVPESHLEAVKDAIFAAGAGQIGRYDKCCWQCLGTGQFRPLAGSQPHLGELQTVTTVREYQVETVLDAALVPDVVAALKQAHPYEEPAFAVWPIQTS